MTRSSLLEVTYTDTKQNIHLTNYADTIVYDASENGKKTTICAIRFGGYPEMVNAMASALYGGGSVNVTLYGTQQKFEALSKQYRKIITHNGPYAEATFIAEDDSQQAKTSDDETPDAPKDLPPRTTYIFSKTDDPRELFEAVDQKTAVPLILEYQDFVLSELKRKGILKPLKVISASANISAWTLRCSDGDKNIVDIVEKGLKHGDISIPGAVPGPTPLDSLHSVTQYLNTFGVTVAERIKKLFVPQYDPAEEPLSPEVVEINDYIHQNTGYSLFNDILCELRGKGIHISDRKLFSYYPLAQAKAWLSGRDTVSPPDLIVLRHYLWTDPTDRDIINPTLERMCNDPLKDKLESILKMALESCDDFNATATDTGGKEVSPARRIGKLRGEFLKP